MARKTSNENRVFLYEKDLAPWKDASNQGVWQMNPPGETHKKGSIRANIVNETTPRYLVSATAVSYEASIRRVDSQEALQDVIVFQGTYNVVEYNEDVNTDPEITKPEWRTQGRIWLARPPEDRLRGRFGLHYVMFGLEGITNERVEEILRGQDEIHRRLQTEGRDVKYNAHRSGNLRVKDDDFGSTGFFLSGG